MAEEQRTNPASSRICADGLRSWKRVRGREPDNGTPAHPDLRLDLLRHLQGVQDTGQPMVACDRGAGRDHRHCVAAADHELQSSLHHQCPHLFCRDSRVSVGQGPRDRGAGAGERAAQGRGCAVPGRPEAVPIRGRPEEGFAGGSRAERDAAQGLARSGSGSYRKGQCAVRVGAAELRPASRVVPKAVIAQATLDTYTRNLETARQSLTGTKAEEERARLAFSSNIDGVNTTVARLRSELADAQWDLDQTVTRAPAAGFVTQVSLRPGMYVVPAAFRSVMVFVNTDPRDQEFTAAFQQNSLQRVKAGDEAEAAFDAV